MRPFILLATLVASAVLATPALANGADLDEPAAVPRSHQIKAQHRRSALEAAAELASRAKKGARLTYYWGRQLEAPACGGPTPTDDDMIAAIVDPKKGGGYAKCGDRITLSHKGRQITVKVVDYCASCAVPGFDLSKGAFAKLADLDQGVIEDVEFWKTGSLLSSSQDDDEEIKLGGGSAAQSKGPREKQQLNRSHPSKSKSTKSKQQRKEARKQSRMAKKAAKKHGKKSKKSKKAKKDRHNDN